jgi:hypothetical protein
MPKNSDHDMKWRNLPDHDYFLFARSYHLAAKKLVGMLDMDPGPIPEFDLCPILSAYRHAIELHLKVIVLGDGGNFLATKPDELSVQKTRSLSWLAQFVVQIVTALKWEGEFKTEGIESLADFKAVIEEANGIDASFQAFRCPADPGGQDMLKSTVLEFVRRLDVLLELLAQTADSLAAEFDLRSHAAALEDGNDFSPTIQ